MSQRGLDRGTLLVVTSDHGEEFLDHGSWEHQKTLYEEVIRVPLVVRGPGIRPRREPAQTSLLDVAPTILEWTGLDSPGSAQGVSLLSPPGKREAYGETHHAADATRKLFLREGGEGWKAILSLTPDGDRLVEEEWFDLAADPTETRQMPPAPDATRAARDRALERWRRGRAGDLDAPAVELTEAQRERLRALGYVLP
jgi:arylsulfatase A-like enzyme